MELSTSLIVLLVVLLCGPALFLLTAYHRTDRAVLLRPIDAFGSLRDQTGRAVESGRGIHFSLGHGDLSTSANPASVAALGALSHLNQAACRSDVPPLVTTGSGTLLLAGQDSLRGAYRLAGRAGDYEGSQARFLADATSPMTFAAGASELIGDGHFSGNIMLGRFGAELAIIAQAAERENMEQIAGSDDPVALAVSASVTNKILIGEELFAAGAYLQSEPIQIASLQLQDLLRTIAAAGILFAALLGALAA